MADISTIINVTLLQDPGLAADANLNVVMMITSETGFLSSAKRFAAYKDITSVGQDLGTNSDAYAYAKTFFATSPNAVNANGVLQIGFWRATSENVAATTAVLQGAQLSEAEIIGQLQTISDGSFDIVVDGAATQNIVDLDFRTITSLTDVAAIIDSEIAGANAILNDQNQIVITTVATGVLALLTFLSPGATGTYIGTIVALGDDTGATLTQGADASVLPPETKIEAITILKAQANMFGALFIDKPTEIEAADLAAWSQTTPILLYDVFSSASNLLVDITNVVWNIKLAGYTHYRMLFSGANNRLFAAAYMARQHTTNFAVENSALTMNVKELPIVPEDYSSADIDSAATVGLDVYTSFDDKNTEGVIMSGANDFTDNVYNLLAFVDELQTALFNLLKQTTTKIPQTTQGVNQLVAVCEEVSTRFVRNGVLAPGTWNSPDTFGDIKTFDRNILENGYYWLAGLLSDQTAEERASREFNDLQGAIKLAGAIQKVNVIVHVNI